MNLDEVFAQPPNEASGFLVRGDQRGDNGDAMLFQPAREVAHPADVRIALLSRETGLGKDIAYGIAIEVFHAVSPVFQILRHS